MMTSPTANGRLPLNGNGRHDPFSEDEFDEKSLKPVPIKALFIDERHYRQMGFLCAVEEFWQPEERFQELLDEQQKLHEERVLQLQEVHLMTDLRLQEKIADVENALENVEVKQAFHLSEVAELSRQLEEEKNRLDLTKTKLSQLIETIGEKLERLIDDRILAVRRELEGIIENYRTAYEQRFAINQQTFQDNREALNIKVQRFQALRIEFETIQAAIQEKTKQLRIEGINPPLANLLVTIGFWATLATGFFFSIFTLSKHLSQESVLFFFISGLHRFITETFTTHSLWEKFLLATGVFVAAFLLMTFAAWLCHRGMNGMQRAAVKDMMKGQNTSDYSVSLDVGNPKSLRLKAYAESSSFFHLWVQLSPLLLLTGIAFIFVFIGTTSANIQDLDISLTGTLIGTVLTILLAGLAYLYVAKIIEPRCERHKQASLLANHFELVASGILFLISTLGLLFLPDKNNPWVIFEFSTVLLVVAFLQGYALRIKALFSSSSYLESRINALFDAIRDNSRPRPLNLTTAEDKRFKREYLTLTKQLFQLMQQKNEIVLGVLRGAKTLEKERWWHIWTRFWKGKGEEAGVATLSLTELEGRMMPRENLQAQEMEMDLLDTKALIAKLDQEIVLRKEERSTYWKDLKTEKEQMKIKLDNYKKARERFIKELYESIANEVLQLEKINLNMKEGFMEHMRNRVHFLGPFSGNYFPISSIEKK